MYRDGIDVAKDASKALDLYRKSAASGSASAQFALAEMCLRGEGAEADYVQAYLFASLAAAQGLPKADKLRSKAAQKLSPDELAEAEALVAQATASPR
jgi:TPR repeat protein